MLYEKSRCLIVDMESHAAAQIAAEAKIPFAVMRVVCDSSNMDVPPVVMAAIDEDGSINGMKATCGAYSCDARRKQIPSLFHVGKGTWCRALKILKKASVSLLAGNLALIAELCFDP